MIDAIQTHLCYECFETRYGEDAAYTGNVYSDVILDGKPSCIDCSHGQSRYWHPVVTLKVSR